MPDKTYPKDGPQLNPDIIDQAIMKVLEETTRAENKHGPLPDDFIYASAIVNMEAGELLHAAMNYSYADPPPGLDNLIEETTQTAAMATRFLHDLLLHKAILEDGDVEN